MIQGNYQYKDYWRDVSKLFGASTNPVAVADSFSYTQQNVIGTTNNSIADIRTQNGALAAIFSIYPSAFFHGSWAIEILCSNFALAGGCVVYGLTPNVGGVQASGPFSTFRMGSRTFAAQDPLVQGNPVIAQSQMFFYSDTCFSNIALFYGSGVGNTYTINIKFDGVRVTW